jgi:sulfide:quinone oxidoreductase
MKKQVLVLGGNFGGLTAAITLKKALHGDVDVTVMSDRDYFLYNPSLIWLPFGLRTRDDITFKVGPTFEAAGVEFVQKAAAKIEPELNRVVDVDGVNHQYDYLVIATGTVNDWDRVPGVKENAGTIVTLADAEDSGRRWREFLNDPGDIVIGATQGASCFGAAYEYLFNVSYQLRKAGIKKQVKLTYVTAEPYLGHFGIDGMPTGEFMVDMFMKKESITGITNMAMEYVSKDAVKLADGRELPFKYAMVVPPFLGVDAVRSCDTISNAAGFVPVRDTYQTKMYDNVYAVGLAAAVQVPWTTPVAVGVPKTGFPTEIQAHVAAANIASQIAGLVPTREKPFAEIPALCVMDAGNNGIMLLGDHMLKPRRAAMLIPGPQNHAIKVGLEKYFLWKSRTGRVNLP